MSMIKLHTYCGNNCSTLILDSSRPGRKTIKIDRTLSELQEDVSYAVDCANDQFTISADYFEFKAGGPYLTPGAFVEITSSKLKLFAVVTDIRKEEYYNYFSIKGKNEIAIGRTSPCSICYNFGNFISNKPHCLMTYDKAYDTYVLKNTSGSPSVYVNNLRVDDSIPLYFGDEISIVGLSIVFLGLVLAVNNPLGMMTTALSQSRDDIFKLSKPKNESEFTRSTRIYKSPIKEQFVIDAPISKNQEQKLPAALTVGPAITMGVSMVASMMVSLSSAASSGASAVPGILMSGSMLAGMLIWPNAMKKWQEKNIKNEEIIRKKSYTDYINKSRENLEKNSAYNLSILNEKLIEAKTIANWIYDEALSRRIWERSYYDEDFIEARLGTGKRRNISEIEIPKLGYLSESDELNKLPASLKDEYEYIDEAPISIDLKKLNSVGIIGSSSIVTSIALNMAFQLAALHDSSELKLVFIYNKRSEKNFEWVKKLPHVWNEDLDFRFIANNKDEVQTLFRYLSSELENRLNEENKRNTAPLPNYLIFALSKELVEDISVSKFVNADYSKTGFATIFAFGNINSIPNGCKALIQCAKDNCGVYSNIDSAKGLLQFKKDDIDLNAIFNFATEMTLFKTDTSKSKAGIPASASFLDLFKAASIEEINILSKWSESNPEKSLAVPIGIKNGGELFKLDIHEKYHGSHGLLAGTTGSGKSECIQAIILSLAVHFHPDDVSFVLIDFKGGGMANCFTGMPHLAGTITNLGNQIRRSMVSLNSELKRRQNMLKEAGVNHIDKYQALFKAGNVKLPMPHLVIVSDEFAELKQQQPEFMNELISVARIGRSLGVHLILATQKPSGVVDDQIWSNTRFRICLKVADKSDSVGMVGVPAAAAITLPGRGYVQVGFNEVFELVQTAYTGADYIPVDKFINKEQQRVTLIDSCGQTAASAELKATSLKDRKKQTQLEAVVEYLGKISSEHKINRNLIWQEPLKKIISLSEIQVYAERKVNKAYNVFPVVGVIDDPETQSQYPLSIDLSDKGHMILYGMQGSGKTTFLQTIIFSTITTYSAAEVSLNILDFGGRVLELFSAAPQVKNVFFPDDSEKLQDLFMQLIDEIDVRRNKFSRVRQENLSSYRKATGEKLPVIILVIDNFGKFYEQCYEYEETLGTIVREGAKYGVTIIATANTVNTISYKLADYFAQKYTLQLSDPSDYTAVVGSTMGMKPEPLKGRGLTRYDSRLVEYHTALAFEEVDDGIRSQLILSEIGKLKGYSENNKNKSSANNEDLVSTSYLNDDVKHEEADDLKADSGKITGNEASQKNNKDNYKEKKSGFSLPGFGSSSKASKNKKTEDFKTYLNHGETLVIANDRKTDVEYSISLKVHPTFYIMHEIPLEECDFMVKLSENILKNRLGSIEYFGKRPISDMEGLTVYRNEEDLTKLIDKISSHTGEQSYLLIDDFMEFYRAISDNDLARLEALLPSLKDRKIFIIVATNLGNAQILKDYPLGIFLFKTYPRGILMGGKPIDFSSVLPNELINKLSYEDLNYITSKNAALLFDEKGDSAKVTPNFT